MIKYIIKKVNNISNKTIESNYLYLLNNKLNFVIINYKNINYLLTKEKSFFEIDDLDKFLNNANKDIYYNTIICDNDNYLIDDLRIYYDYLNKYKKEFEEKYGNKYLFGCVAVKTISGNMITNIRGKENLNEFTIVSNIDNNLIYACNKKASLNAPLLYNLLKNDRIKSIVHINHKYDDRFIYLDYAFPGTFRDTNRPIDKSFNITNHGLFILFDEEGKEIV